MRDEDLVWLIALNRVTNCTPKQKHLLFEQYGSARAILFQKKEAERRLQKKLKVDGNPLVVERAREDAEKALAYCLENGIAVIGITDHRYPVRLKYIYDPPLILFAKGETGLLQGETAVGVVGSRKASNWGIGVAYSVGKELSKVSVTVVSGLAFGIDYYAHKGALDGTKATVAVLGNGIDVVYPKGNSNMYDRMKREALLLSEFPIGTPPYKHNFPRRNRVISGLCDGVVVVEASKTSGALITAQYAMEQGREVMAFPGKAQVDSYAGNNSLIKDGAHLVETPWDILSILGKDLKHGEERSTFFCSPLENDILKVIGDDKVSLEDIEKVLKSSVSEIVSALMMLELEGAVVQYPGKIFSRVEEYGR
jgi:DNA processing protein